MVPKFRVYETDRKAMHYTDKDLVVCFSDNGVDVIDHTTFSSSCMDIDNFVLMQSTGLKDKNGVEIFEGDIVKAVRKHSEPKLIEDRYCKGIITYSHGCYDIKVEPNVFSGLIPENLLTDIDLTIEVIGNIYEHGDLLK